ncbi:DUF4345 domain-containing protein [Tenacibaculum tangerinum]|uniref:DUF4345 domain-containing protein n=1 Tax=Tenacibaculum tangerinum TaxID=3038772 RepID=A0ABY8L0X8_9FLAO|nr:DUF4345 domain-containing protein [Tenacibaculum tangerinum]WGH75127.1 DUF4345 domain-containing protein [Tenacibaculum tangerinum]
MNLNVESLAPKMLVFSAIILIIIAISFGGNPIYFIPNLYHTEAVNDINSIAIYRSVMGLILGCCTFWLYAAFTRRFVLGALYSLMFAMFGLSISRIISLLVDGSPTTILMVYLFMEAATGFTVYAIIRAYEKKSNS